MSKSEDVEVVYGSGNVYRDFGYADADARLAKDILAAEIIRVLRTRKITNRAAEKITGVSHTEFSRIKQPDLKRFTIDRLMNIMSRLDPQIDITMKIKTRSKKAKPRQPELAL